MGESPVTLILQMGRVASRSWYEAIKAADPNAAVFHFHFVSPQSRDLIRALSSEDGPAQTIRRPRLLRSLETLPAELSERFVDGRWIGGPLRIVSGVRDPLSRGASFLMFSADVFGHRNLPLAFREGGDIASLLSYLRRAWSDALGYTQPGDSFTRLVCFLLAQYRSWFATELNTAFGIDIFDATPETGRRTWRIANDAVEVLVYRYEDLPSGEIVKEVGRFLDLDLDPLPATNRTGSRRSGDLYGQLRERSRLPSEWLERIYAEPIVPHFYSDKEIIALKTQSSLADPFA